MKPEGFRGVFRDDDLARAVYSEGAGIAQDIPSAVAVPADAADVQTIVRWAEASGRPLIPRGSASGMAGGAVGPGVVVDLSRLQKLGAIDRATKAVWAEPGVVCQTVNNAARADGLRFPVDPSSAAFCTIGGMAATNAAGPHSLRFGAMRNWVRSLDCVFSDGSRAVVERGKPAPKAEPVTRFLAEAPRIEREWNRAAKDHAALRKDSSGYALARYFETGELLDLIVGSEGTLAVAVGVELQLNSLPGATTSLMAAFTSLDDAARGAVLAREAGASACELLDKTFLDLAATAAESSAPLREWAASSAAVLLAGIEADDAASAETAALGLRAAFEKAGAKIVEVALTPDSERGVWELRHAASPILSRLGGVTSMQFIEDGAVPSNRLADYVRGVRAALDGHGITGVIFGHAGDAHVHVNPLVDVTVAGWRETVAGLLNDVVALTASLGGTLAGEHGDGRLRTPLMPRVWSAAAMNAFGEVKRCFDPVMILNPGVKVPLEGQAAIGRIKYDPSLPPLPAAARAALDGVVARRGYADFRLSLIN